LLIYANLIAIRVLTWHVLYAYLGDSRISERLEGFAFKILISNTQSTPYPLKKYYKMTTPNKTSRFQCFDF